MGRLKFSDDQLLATQKGLKDAGVAMPNFGNVGKELAKEINEEPEVEVETEEESEFPESFTQCQASHLADDLTSPGSTVNGERTFDYRGTDPRSRVPC